jgi:hypothetical protein
MTKFEHKDDPVHFVAFFKLMLGVRVRVMVLNITFNNISVNLQLSELLESVQVCANHEMLWTKDF